MRPPAAGFSIARDTESPGDGVGAVMGLRYATVLGPWCLVLRALRASARRTRDFGRTRDQEPSAKDSRSRKRDCRKVEALADQPHERAVERAGKRVGGHALAERRQFR